MASILDHFDALTNNGLKIIPLHENSKAPLCYKWTSGWNREAMRGKIKSYPKSNIGLLLGEIIDVEGDSEDANNTILGLIKDYPHPTYRSSKSIHHLFLTPDNSLRHFEWNNIEFRGYGHQSVLPPSKTPDVVYKWLKSFKFPVPEMPEELVSFLERKRNVKRRPKTKPNHIKVRCFACEKEIFLHKKRHALELKGFKLLGQRWECQNCRSIDLRPVCRLLRAGAPSKVVLINGFN
jgi:hypothetical protein